MKKYIFVNKEFSNAYATFEGEGIEIIESGGDYYVMINDKTTAIFDMELYELQIRGE